MLSNSGDCANMDSLKDHSMLLMTGFVVQVLPVMGLCCRKSLLGRLHLLSQHDHNVGGSWPGSDSKNSLIAAAAKMSAECPRLSKSSNSIILQDIGRQMMVVEDT